MLMRLPQRSTTFTRGETARVLAAAVLGVGGGEGGDAVVAGVVGGRIAVRKAGSLYSDGQLLGP